MRFILGFAFLASTAVAFSPSPLASYSPLSLRRSSNACSSLKMIDWGSPTPPKPSGAGSDRGQINQSDKIGSIVEQRIAEAKRIAEEKNIGARSGLDTTGKLREGDRDPVTGRLILDPLKIPTGDQGAPGSWEEYMRRRKEKEGTVKDAFGNVIESVKPSYAVQPGTWGPPKVGDSNTSTDDILGLGKKEVSVGGLSAEQEEWKRQKEAEKAAKEAEIEARMQKWLADAAKKDGK